MSANARVVAYLVGDPAPDAVPRTPYKPKEAEKLGRYGYQLEPLILQSDHLAELEAARWSGRREGVAQRLIELKRPLAAKAKLSPAEARRLRDLDRAIAKILLGEDYREPEELTEEQQIKMAKMARAALLPSPPPPATPEDPSP